MRTRERSLSLASRMARRAIDMLRAGVQEMRDALTGRNYVADYVQNFTHEVKSPLSAIRGAAELLQEPSMPQAEREHFLVNITRETQRIQEIVDRMMELTALESAARCWTASESFRSLLAALLRGRSGAPARRTATSSPAQHARAVVDAFACRRPAPRATRSCCGARAISNPTCSTTPAPSIDFSPRGREGAAHAGNHVAAGPRQRARATAAPAFRTTCAGKGLPGEVLFAGAAATSQKKSTVSTPASAWPS